MNDTASKLDTVLNELYENEQFNGGILVAKGDSVIFKNAYGYSNVEAKKLLNENTVFQTASISKTFTAVAILQLIENGELRLDSKLVDFFPELPYKDVTIRHMLTHTTGFYPYNPLFKSHWDPDKIAVNDDIIKMYITQQPEQFFTPGTEYGYSNIGYVFLASIVEKISGLGFEEYLNQKIFDPLQMDHTQIYTLLSKQRIDNFAEEHVLDPLTGSYKNPLDLEYHKETYYLNGKVGDDKVASTLEDLWKWNRALFTYQILPKKTLEKAFTSSVKQIPDSLWHVPFDYGLGFQLEDHETHGKIIYHNGGEPGLKARFLYYKDLDISLVLYSNAHAEYIRPIRKLIMSIILDEPFEMPKKSIANEIYKVAKQGKTIMTKVANTHINDTTYYMNERELNHLAGIFWGKEDYNIGFDVLKLNVELFPESINARYYLAEGYYETGQIPESITHLKEIKTMLLAMPEKERNSNYLTSIENLIKDLTEGTLK